LSQTLWNDLSVQVILADMKQALIVLFFWIVETFFIFGLNYFVILYFVIYCFFAASMLLWK